MIQEKYTPPLSAHDYFNTQILPSDINAAERTETGVGRYEQHDNKVEFILVRGGSGKIVVNAGSYELHRGDMFCICSHHFHRLEATPGQKLEFTECRINGGMFLYIASCPYYRPSSISIPYAPIHLHFDEEATARIETMFRRIANDSRPNSQMSFFSIVRLFGLMERYGSTTDLVPGFEDGAQEE